MNYPDPSWIAHYTSVESALKILSTGKIRFSSLSRVNDPKESRERWRGITHGGYPFGEEINRVSKEFLEEYRSGPFHSDSFTQPISGCPVS